MDLKVFGLLQCPDMQRTDPGLCMCCDPDRDAHAAYQKITLKSVYKCISDLPNGILHPKLPLGHLVVLLHPPALVDALDRLALHVQPFALEAYIRYFRLEIGRAHV